MKRVAINVPGLPPQLIGSHAVRAGDYVFLGGQTPFDPLEGLVSQVRGFPGEHLPQIASKAQSEYILDRSAKILEAAESSLVLGVRIDQFCTDPKAASPYLEARGRVMETATRPASTHVMVESLLVPGALSALQLIALVKDGAQKEIIVVPGMPSSPGPPFKPAPHGVVGNDFIFVTGQVAHGFGDDGLALEARTDPETWYGSPIKLQADFTLKRCERVLNHVGASLTDVVKADVYLTDMDDRFELEQVWSRHFPSDPPARTYLPVTRLGPRSCIIEITLIAIKPSAGLKKETITAAQVPTPNLHHPHAIRAGNFLFISGLCATDFKGGLAPAAQTNPNVPWFGSSGKKQTAFILDCLDAICRAGGARLENVVWTQNLYSRPGDVHASREVWDERFPSAPPATLVAGVKGPMLGENCTITVDAVAVA